MALNMEDFFVYLGEVHNILLSDGDDVVILFKIMG